MSGQMKFLLTLWKWSLSAEKTIDNLPYGFRFWLNEQNYLLFSPLSWPTHYSFVFLWIGLTIQKNWIEQ